MKRHILQIHAILILFSVVMLSCEKEKPLGEQIIGIWDVESIKKVTYEGNEKKSEVTIFLNNSELRVQFAEGGTGIMYENGEDLGTFDWSLAGNILTAHLAEPPLNWEISIDENTLVWSFNETEVVDNKTLLYKYFYTAKRGNESL